MPNLIKFGLIRCLKSKLGFVWSRPDTWVPFPRSLKLFTSNGKSVGVNMMPFPTANGRTLWILLVVPSLSNLPLFWFWMVRYFKQKSIEKTPSQGARADPGPRMPAKLRQFQTANAFTSQSTTPGFPERAEQPIFHGHRLPHIALFFERSPFSPTASNKTPAHTTIFLGSTNIHDKEYRKNTAKMPCCSCTGQNILT